MIRFPSARRSSTSKFRKDALGPGHAALDYLSPLPNEPHKGAKVKYKRSLLRRGILAGAMVLAGGGASLAVASAPAGASNTQMTGVGSFTTFFMMHALFPEVNMINPIAESGSQTQSIAGDSLTCQGGLTFSTGT